MLALCGASFAFSMPILASASIFSSLLNGSATTVSGASAGTSNSQRMSLLAPAVNLDPSPSVGGGGITMVNGSALIAQEGPSGTAADIENLPTNQQISVYTVRPGDTLSSIAEMFDVSVNTILGANDIKKGVIQPGQVLIILPITGVQHTVVKGETMSSLAKKYSSDAHGIAVYNGLADGQALTVGEVLLIPNGVLAPAPSKSTPKPKNIAGGSGPVISGYYIWPVAGGVVTQGLHGWNGVDIGAPKGTSIYAAAGGTVIVANGNGAWNGGYGSYIVIQHSNGTQTLYSHLSKVLVSPGVQVDQGEVIGKVGSTGESTGFHLHFEVRGTKNPFASLRVGSR